MDLSSVAVEALGGVWSNLHGAYREEKSFLEDQSEAYCTRRGKRWDDLNQDGAGMVKQAWERGWGTDLRSILEVK